MSNGIHEPMTEPKAEPGSAARLRKAIVLPLYFLGTISLEAANASCWSPAPIPIRVDPGITLLTEDAREPMIHPVAG